MVNLHVDETIDETKNSAYVERKRKRMDKHIMKKNLFFIHVTAILFILLVITSITVGYLHQFKQ